MNMNRQNKKHKPVIWQDIVPVQKPKTPWQKFIYKIKKNHKDRKLKRQIQNTQRQIAIKNSLRISNRKKTPIFFQKKIIVICIFGVITIALLFFYKNQNQTIAVTKTNQETSNEPNKLTKGTPKYQTITPAGKNIDSLGGWTRVSPSNADPVYAYVDKIGNTVINVSEQPLPEDFKTDTEQQIAQLAQNFKANEKITISGTIVYIGTSSDGTQSLIFSKKDLLILIKSTAKIENNSWTQYINLMQ